VLSVVGWTFFLVTCGPVVGWIESRKKCESWQNDAVYNAEKLKTGKSLKKAHKDKRVVVLFLINKKKLIYIHDM
jgi:hypothetical protein